MLNEVVLGPRGLAGEEAAHGEGALVGGGARVEEMRQEVAG